MFSSFLAAFCLFQASALGLARSSTQSKPFDSTIGSFLLKPAPGLSIGEVLSSTLPDNDGNGTYTLYGNNTDAADVPGPPLSDTNPTLSPRSKFSRVNSRPFSAYYNTSEGVGYNITLPGGLCADTPVGDFQTPSGSMFQNATILDVFNSMRLPSNVLNNFTSTRLEALQEKFNATLSNATCDTPAGGSRDLLFRVNAEDQEGFWSALIVGSGGIFGIGWVGLHYGIVHQGITANITLDQQVLILAGTGVAEFVFVTLIFRLQQKKFISQIEAFVLNLFIIGAEGILAAFQHFWNGVCTTSAQFAEAISNFGTAVQQRIQPFVGRLGAAGESSVDLVGQGTDMTSGTAEGSCST